MTRGAGARDQAVEGRRPNARGARLVWASPLPPTRSGVSDYAAELLPELERLTEVTVVEPPDWKPEGRPSWLAGAARIAANEPPPPGAAHLVHLGNNPYHLWLAARLRAFGGIVVLHDAVLHHLLVEEAAADGDWRRFATELEAAHREAGGAVAEARRWGFRGAIDPFLLDARAAYLCHASAVVTHNERAAAAVRERHPELPVVRVPLAVAELPCGDRSATRESIGAGEDEVVLAHIGFLTPAKGLDVVLLALGTLKELGVPCRLVIVGEGSEEATARRLVATMGLEPKVVFAGFVSSDRLGALIGASDLGLVPRYPTAGETSAAVLRFLASGTPVVVSGYGQFLELPSDAAFRVPPGRAGVADLVRTVATLAAAPTVRARARERARLAWQRGGHAPADAARALVAALEGIGYRFTGAGGTSAASSSV